MKPQDAFFSRENRYSLGLDLDLESNRHYASLPVSNRMVDYEEYFALSAEEFADYLANPAAAIAFVQECRRHEHDDRLLQLPGSDRGTPT